jgi:hypothetical protein
MKTFDLLPEQIKPTIDWMAYQRGHSAGEAEVELHRQSMAEDLLQCIHQYGRDCYANGFKDGKDNAKLGLTS